MEVANIGNAEGSYEAILKVGDSEVDSEEVTVAPGAKERVSFAYVLDTPGSIDVDVGGRGFTVKVLKPAQLRVKSLSVTPPLVFPNQKATISANVTNVGEVEGDLLVRLKVDGVEADYRRVTLKPGASESVSFEVIRDAPGSYEIRMGTLSATLTVPELATYNDESFNYFISYPADWTVSVGEIAPDYVFISSPTKELVITVETSLLPPDITVDDYYELYVEATERNLPGFVVLSRTPIEADGETLGYRFEAEYPIEGGTARSLGEVTKRGRAGWFRRVDTSRVLFEINKPLLRAILDSFVPPVVATGSYVDTEEGFALRFPRGWDGFETDARPRLLDIFSPLGGPVVNSGMNIFDLSEEVSAQDIALARAAFYADVWSAYEIISRGTIALGRETQGYEIVATFTTGDGSSSKVKDVVVVRGTQAFAIYAWASESAFRSLSDEIDALITSFTFVEPMEFGVSRKNSLFLAGGEILTLDPALYRGGAGGNVGAIFSGLVMLDKNLEVIPDLAEGWEVSEDGTVYTFRLREGLHFHDGKPVTAYDVKYSWERAADPATESPTARTYLGDIVGVKEKLDGELEEISGVDVVDASTLRVTIDGPKPYFLQKLAYPTAYVVDRVNVQSGKTWTERANGTGPFKLKKWVEDEILILERNNAYYRGIPKLTHVVYRLFAGRSMTMYQQGEIDVTGVGVSNLDRVLDPADPLHQELVVNPNLCTGYLAFNVTMPPCILILVWDNHFT